MIKYKALTLIMLTLFCFGCDDKYNSDQKEANAITEQQNEEATKDLNWNDNSDFDILEKNLIASFNSLVKDDQTGKVIFDPKEYDNQKRDTKSPASVNPSLWRQAKLNNYRGLYKVVDGIYQVRGTDMANLSIVETNNGYVVMDVLSTRETSKAALELFFKHMPKKPIIAMIYSHSHADHYGGSEGITTSKEAKAGKIMVIAPDGMNEAVMKENVVAGTAMSRRAFYMYGAGLDNNDQGHVDNGLGKYLPQGGHVTYIVPNTIIDKSPTQQLTIDGVDFIFQLTPGTEAPSEMNVYIPKYKAVFMAENITHVLHNFLTPRGAQARNSIFWANAIQDALNLFGPNVEVMFNAHHWPTWGNKEVIRTLENERNLIKQLHDQSVKMINQGYKINEVGNYLELSPKVSKEWQNRPYYGDYKFNAMAVYQYYLGFFSGNPVDINRLPEVEVGKRFVKTMGGSKNVMEKANEAFKEGDYQWAAEMMNYVVMSEPDNNNARYLLADIYEQMGYKAESGPQRNFYLTGAKELRKQLDLTKLLSSVKGTVSALSVNDMFNLIGTMVDVKKLDMIDEILYVNFTDTKESTYVIIQDGTIIASSNLNYKKSTKTITTTKAQFIQMLLAKLSGQEPDLSSVKGDKDVIKAILNSAVAPNPQFSIVTSNVNN